MSTIDETKLAASAHQVLREAIDPRLPGLYRGKVRDNYDLPDERRILVTSDRLSAFDRVKSLPIPPPISRPNMTPRGMVRGLSTSCIGRTRARSAAPRALRGAEGVGGPCASRG